jgi:pyruvyltransferase
VKIRTYHWTGEGSGQSHVSNFGDGMGSLLLKRFAGIRAVPTTFANAELVTVGSILQLAPKGWRGVIAGSGKIRENSPFLPSRQTTILALRGPLTSRGIAGSYALGDPGLLSDEILDQLPDKEHELGLCAHWSDKELAKRPEFLKYNPLIINVADDPLTVIRQIGSCKKIVASAMHAIIVADSMGIPRRIEPCKLWGIDGTFKWLDYHASINHPFVTGKTTQPKYSIIEDRKHSLHDVFRSLRGEVSW